MSNPDQNPQSPNYRVNQVNQVNQVNNSQSHQSHQSQARSIEAGAASRPDPELDDVLMEILMPITILVREATSTEIASSIGHAYREVLHDLSKLMDDTYTEGFRDGMHSVSEELKQRGQL